MISGGHKCPQLEQYPRVTFGRRDAENPDVEVDTPGDEQVVWRAAGWQPEQVGLCLIRRVILGQNVIPN